MINKGETSAICTCLIFSEFFFFSFFFSLLMTSTTLKLGKNASFLPGVWWHWGSPLCGAAQHILSHTVLFMQQAAFSTADERFSPPMTSGGSEGHSQLLKEDNPSKSRSHCPCTLPAWEVREQHLPPLARCFFWHRPSWLQGILLGMVSGGGFGRKWAYKCRKGGRRDATSWRQLLAQQCWGGC